MKIQLLSLALTLPLAACAPSGDDATRGGAFGGKADSVSGATCDQFGHEVLGQTSHDVAEFIASGEIVELSDWDDLSLVQKRQLEQAVLHLRFLHPQEFDEGPAIIFDVPDEEMFEILELEADTEEIFLVGDWVRFGRGDTEVGVIFDAGTTNIIAEIGDGDVSTCIDDGLGEAAIAVRSHLFSGLYHGTTGSGFECEVRVDYGLGTNMQVHVGSRGTLSPVTFLMNGTETESAAVESLPGSVRVSASGADVNEAFGPYQATRTVQITLDDAGEVSWVRTTVDRFNIDGHTHEGYRCSNLELVDSGVEPVELVPVGLPAGVFDALECDGPFCDLVFANAESFIYTRDASDAELLGAVRRDMLDEHGASAEELGLVMVGSISRGTLAIGFADSGHDLAALEAVIGTDYTASELTTEFVCAPSVNCFTSKYVLNFADRNEILVVSISAGDE